MTRPDQKPRASLGHIVQSIFRSKNTIAPFDSNNDLAHLATSSAQLSQMDQVSPQFYTPDRPSANGYLPPLSASGQIGE